MVKEAPMIWPSTEKENDKQQNTHDSAHVLILQILGDCE